MTNKKKLVGILSILLVFGFFLVGCQDESNTSLKDVLDGTTWETTGTEVIEGTSYAVTGNLVFTNPNCELKWDYVPASGEPIVILVSGTYTISGNDVTIKFESPYPEWAATISGNSLTFHRDEGDVVFNQK
jgi:hypothetical protein